MAFGQPCFGVTIFPTDTAIQPTDVARAVEDRGLDSLFFPEHTHIPVSRQTPFPGGTDLPEMYKRTHDPFVALGAAAAVTERIRLGTGICLVIERDPITLAKEVASLDVISNGRVVLGIGAGWNREEMENHGADYARRWPIVREKILAMKAIWADDEASFHGEFVDFDPIWSWPKPVQSGGPPIWVGANSKWVYERVAEYGDGWMPIGGRGGGFDIEQMRSALQARGQTLEDMDLALFGAPTKEDAVRRHIDDGFDHFVFFLPPEGPDTVLPILDKLSRVAENCR